MAKIDRSELETFVKVFNKSYSGKHWAEASFLKGLDNWLEEKAKDCSNRIFEHNAEIFNSGICSVCEKTKEINK